MPAEPGHTFSVPRGTVSVFHDSSEISVSDILSYEAEGQFPLTDRFLRALGFILAVPGLILSPRRFSVSCAERGEKGVSGWFLFRRFRMNIDLFHVEHSAALVFGAFPLPGIAFFPCAYKCGILGMSLPCSTRNASAFVCPGLRKSAFRAVIREQRSPRSDGFRLCNLPGYSDAGAGEAPFGKVTAHLPFRSAERQYPVLACRDFQMNSATEIKGGFAVCRFFYGAILPMSGIRGGRHALFRTESASCRDFRTESRIRTRRIVFRDFRAKAKNVPHETLSVCAFMFGCGKFRIHLPMGAAFVVANENVLGVRERILFHVERPVLVSSTDMNEFRFFFPGDPYLPTSCSSGENRRRRGCAEGMAGRS